MLAAVLLIGRSITSSMRRKTEEPTIRSVCFAKIADSPGNAAVEITGSIAQMNQHGVIVGTFDTGDVLHFDNCHVSIRSRLCASRSRPASTRFVYHSGSWLSDRIQRREYPESCGSNEGRVL